MSITVQKIEYHQVHLYRECVFEEDELIEEFGSVERFQDIAFAADNEYYEPDGDPISDEESDKFWDFMAEQDWDAVEEDWFTDRKGGYEIEYRFPEDDE